MSNILEKTRGELSRLSLDYPKQGERIESPFYTLRVTAPQGVRIVEVSIDDGEWQPCREAVGYYWFDWSGYRDGEHEVIARIATPAGRIVAAEPHQVRVQLGGRSKPKSLLNN